MTGAKEMRAGVQIGRMAAVAMLAGLLAAPAALAQKIDLTMGIIVSPGDAYSAMTASVPERVSKATNGRVQITVSDSLVAPAQIASAVRDGRLPMSAALHTYLAADEPRMGIFNLPDLINNIDEYQKVRNAFWAKDVAKIWDEKWGRWCWPRAPGARRACSPRRRSTRSRTSRTSACACTTRRPPPT